MELEPNDLLLFARVADEGSFTAASTRLGLPKSTVSRRLAALEARLGERLLLRTTRKLTLTDFGHGVLGHARQVVAEVEAAAALASHRQVEPSGRLRISMPGDFATVVLGTLLSDFVARYPAISLELDLTPRRVDLIGENFDLALRMGELADDATLAARQVATFSMGLYAAPAYLQRRGRPAEPEALMEHDCLRLLGRSGEAIPWVLSRGDARWEGTLHAGIRLYGADAFDAAFLMLPALCASGLIAAFFVRETYGRLKHEHRPHRGEPVEPEAPT